MVFGDHDGKFQFRCFDPQGFQLTVGSVHRLQGPQYVWLIDLKPKGTRGEEACLEV